MKQLLLENKETNVDFVTLKNLYPTLDFLLEDLNFAFYQLRADTEDEMNKIRYDAIHSTIQYVLRLTERQIYNKELSPGDEDEIGQLINDIQGEEVAAFLNK